MRIHPARSGMLSVTQLALPANVGNGESGDRGLYHWLLQSINGCGCGPPTVVVMGDSDAVVTAAIEALLPPMVATLQWCRRLWHRTVALDRTEPAVATVAQQPYAALTVDRVTGPQWPTVTTADADGQSHWCRRQPSQLKHCHLLARCHIHEHSSIIMIDKTSTLM
ncbi:hypothetical protein [Burkholderia gladioli]|uniref:hypothetical protein n=1 Tax=Burkholderia gladioli TaxID=28095 RepID=UPI001641E1C7|nr:hypothetical protein [Burkholderia gladioli]